MRNKENLYVSAVHFSLKHLVSFFLFKKVPAFTHGQEKKKRRACRTPDKILSWKYRSSSYIGFLTLENWINRLSQNVRQKLQLLAA